MVNQFCIRTGGDSVLPIGCALGLGSPAKVAGTLASTPVELSYADCELHSRIRCRHDLRPDLSVVAMTYANVSIGHMSVFEHTYHFDCSCRQLPDQWYKRNDAFVRVTFAKSVLSLPILAIFLKISLQTWGEFLEISKYLPRYILGDRFTTRICIKIERRNSV